MTRNTGILTMAAGIAAASTIGFFALQAQAAATDLHPVRGRIAEKLAQLGVTDDQKAEIKSILRNYQPTVGPMVRQLVDARRALRTAIRGETVDESAIRAQSAKAASLEADLAVQRAHIAHDVRALLTPDQLAKLRSMQVDLDARIDALLSRVAKRIAED